MSKPIPLFNPLSEDFKYTWLDDGNKPHELTIPGREIAYFPDYQARFMAKHLADTVYNERGRKINPEVDLKAILDEIYVKL